MKKSQQVDLEGISDEAGGDDTLYTETELISSSPGKRQMTASRFQK